MSTATSPLTLPKRWPRFTHHAVARIQETEPRFTLDGSPELEQHLARTCAQIAAGLRGLLPANRLEAVLLGGGYGRGEGGVWRTSEGDRPYDDLECYVFLRGNRHWHEWVHGRALHVLGEILTPQAGLDVEFKIVSRRQFTMSAMSMFSYDLIAGHRRLIGNESFLADCAHHRDAEQIPLAEATRLLMNRGSGLLFAQERLARPTFTPGDADFVARNIAKAQLAVGDAILTAFGQYHWSVRERHQRIERLARMEPTSWFARVWDHHAVGVEFKLHPFRSTAPREILKTQYASIVELTREAWLWIENRRLDAAFGSIREYVAAAGDKCPDTSVARNAVVNLKILGGRTLRAGRWWRHPRERILRALPLLLWEPETLRDPELLASAQRALLTDARTLPDMVGAYRSIWSHVN
jgi:hypothetical protein